MKSSEYWILTIFMVLLSLGGVFLWLTPRDPNAPPPDALQPEPTPTVAQMRFAIVAPSEGSIKGGTKVVITGENIPKDVQVAFGDKLVSGAVVSADGRTIEVVTPEGSKEGGGR